MKLAIIDHKAVDHLDLSYPVLVKNATTHWDALQKWTPEFFRKEHGETTVKIRDFSNPSKGVYYQNIHMTIREYFDYWDSLDETPPNKNWYFANWLYENDSTELSDDYDLPFYLGPDLIEFLPESFQYPRKWLFVGHKFCDTPAHVDTLHTSAWLTMIYNRKRVRMVSPSYSRHFFRLENLRCQSSLDYCSSEGIPVIDVEIERGDLLIIPGGWLHHVFSREPNIMLTGNFLSASDSEQFFDEITEKSGSREQVDQLRLILKSKLEDYDKE